MAWSNEVIFKFIDLYRSESAIWNTTDPLYKDKTKVNDAWDRISEAMDIPVADLKKKKETLMAAFRLNHKKKLASIKSGENIFEPVWIFYEPLAKFLADVYDQKTGSSPTTEEGGSTSFATSQEKWDPVIEVGVEEVSNEEDSRPLPDSSPSRKRRRKSTSSSESQDVSPHDICHKLLANAMTTLAHLIETQQNNKDKEDECDIYGKLIALKLRRLSDMERMELMYEIDSLYIQKRWKRESRDREPSPDDW